MGFGDHQPAANTTPQDNLTSGERLLMATNKVLAATVETQIEMIKSTTEIIRNAKDAIVDISGKSQGYHHHLGCLLLMLEGAEEKTTLGVILGPNSDKVIKEAREVYNS